MLPSRDADLLHILDQSLADATARGGTHLACKPGCTPCCHGVFRISALDALRLRTTLDTLPDPAQAEAIRQRAHSLTETLRPGFPGDPATGILLPEDEQWDDFADLPEADAPCPVLDPGTGRCELYAARPLTCRIFGPPVQNESGIGMCELCYTEATEAEVLHGEMHLHHHELEAELDAKLAAQGDTGETVIAWALVREHRQQNAAGAE